MQVKEIRQLGEPVVAKAFADLPESKGTWWYYPELYFAYEAGNIPSHMRDDLLEVLKTVNSVSTKSITSWAFVPYTYKARVARLNRKLGD